MIPASFRLDFLVMGKTAAELPLLRCLPAPNRRFLQRQRFSDFDDLYEKVHTCLFMACLWDEDVSLEAIQMWLRSKPEKERVPALFFYRDKGELEGLVDSLEGLSVDFLPCDAQEVQLRAKVAQAAQILALKRDVADKEQLVGNVTKRLEQELNWHRETERILSENERTLRSIFQSIEATGEAIVITDRDETIYYANPAYSELSRYGNEEIFGTHIDEFMVLKQTPKGLTLQEIREKAKTQGSWKGEVVLYKKGGEELDVFLDVNTVNDLHGHMDGFIFLQRDISTFKKMLSELERLARIDGLTTLFNRRYFMERFQQELTRAARYGRPLCLLLLDLDHFKKINDNHGHLFGDRVLETTGRIIQNLMRGSDLAGRYGGEELCIALPETPLQGGRIFAERLRRTIEEQVYVVAEGKSMHVTCSIGLAELEIPAANDPSLLDVTPHFKKVDEALYEAKRSGRNCINVAC